MSQDTFVLLTSPRNNAGDFLIKHRAHELLRSFRPDRRIIDLNAWEPFGEDQLKVVNDSAALLLTGGPALWEKTRPKGYPMVDELSRIVPPIVLFGVGWSSVNSSWQATYEYDFNKETRELLRRLQGSPFSSSVRDYHTLNVLRANGVDNAAMTGCPSLFSLPHIGTPIARPVRAERVSFSLGVSLTHSPSMERITKEVILRLREYFAGRAFTVVFHHTLDRARFTQSYGITAEALYGGQVRLAEWLDGEGVAYMDVSGSAARLIEHYSDCDLHIGFRVHAHIFMSSISKPSILITEDGRGGALRQVLGGLIVDGYESRAPSLRARALWRWVPVDHISANRRLPQDLLGHLDYALRVSPALLEQPRSNIDLHLPVLERFMRQLP